MIEYHRDEEDIPSETLDSIENWFKLYHSVFVFSTDDGQEYYQVDEAEREKVNLKELRLEMADAIAEIPDGYGDDIPTYFNEFKDLSIRCLDMEY